MNKTIVTVLGSALLLCTVLSASAAGTHSGELPDAAKMNIPCGDHGDGNQTYNDVIKTSSLYYLKYNCCPDKCIPSGALVNAVLQTGDDPKTNVQAITWYGRGTIQCHSFKVAPGSKPYTMMLTWKGMTGDTCLTCTPSYAYGR